jgi:Ca-activated chloride channel family protein
MSFLWPQMLWLLTLVPVLVLIYILMQRRRHKYALRYASLSLVKEALGRGPGLRRHVPALLFLIGVTFALIAVARPVATITLPSQQGTVILALDVSRSMQANDVKPSRLEAARTAALAFVNNQPKSVYIGIVSFSNNASLVQAPTTNRDEVRAAINRLTPQSATAIGLGILTSVNAIAEQIGAPPVDTSTGAFGQPVPTAPPAEFPPGTYAPAVIVLLSDGQNNINPPPLDILDQAINRGIRIYTVGLGTTSGTVLGFQGRSVRVLLDETTLKQIAQETGGRYYRADNETDLRSIYSNLGTQLVFKAQQTELTAWFTGAALLLLLVAGIISLLWFNRIL